MVKSDGVVKLVLRRLVAGRRKTHSADDLARLHVRRVVVVGGRGPGRKHYYDSGDRRYEDWVDHWILPGLRLPTDFSPLGF